MPPDAVTATPQGGVAVQDILEHRESTLGQRLLASQAVWVTLALAIIVAVMCFLQPRAFASEDNLYNITRNFSFIGIMAMGMTAVIITGGIDLSVGSIMGVVAIVAGLIMHADLPWWLGVVGGLAAGAVCGVLNGFLIAYLNLSSFVVTLGALAIWRSVAVVLSQNKMIYEFGKGSDAFFVFGGGAWLGIATPVWLLIVLGVAFAWVLHGTVWGRHLYAIGGNEQAARLTGIPVDRVKMEAYLFSALCAAAAALLLALLLSTNWPAPLARVPTATQQNHDLGIELMTRSMMIFETAGTTILVAMIAAAATALVYPPQPD